MSETVVKGNIELRRKLEEMAESGAEPSEHRAMLEAISLEFPNTIRPLESSLPEGRYTCGMYVLEFPEDEDYIDIARRGVPHVHAGRTFFEWLLAEDLLREIDEADACEGDLTMYFDNGQWQHVGLWRLNDRIESKWGLGLLYNHRRWEVPRNYGDEIRFFRSISPGKAIMHFMEYAQSRGAPAH